MIYRPLAPLLGEVTPNFETLVAKIAMAWKKILNDTNFREKVFFDEQKGLKKEDRCLRGRQMAHMTHECSRVVAYPRESILDFSDLMNVTLREDDIQGFDARWDEVLTSRKETPEDHILGSFYNMRIRESEQLETILALYDQDTRWRNQQATRALKIRSRSTWNKNIRNRHFEARNDRTASGAPAKQ